MAGPWDDPNEAPGRMARAIAMKEGTELMTERALHLVAEGEDWEAVTISLRRIDNGYVIETGGGERFAETSSELIEQISVALAEWCSVNEEPL